MHVVEGDVEHGLFSVECGVDTPLPVPVSVGQVRDLVYVGRAISRY